MNDWIHTHLFSQTRWHKTLSGLLGVVLFVVVGAQCCHLLALQFHASSPATSMSCHQQSDLSSESHAPEQECHCDSSPSKRAWFSDSDMDLAQHLAPMQTGFVSPISHLQTFQIAAFQKAKHTVRPPPDIPLALTTTLLLI